MVIKLSKLSVSYWETVANLGTSTNETCKRTCGLAPVLPALISPQYLTVVASKTVVSTFDLH